MSKAFFKSKKMRCITFFVDTIKSAGNNIYYGVSSRCFFLETVLGGSMSCLSKNLIRRLCRSCSQILEKQVKIEIGQ